MWSNDKFILASEEIKKARRRLLVSFVFVFSVFIGIFSQILSFPFQEKSKLLLANQLANIDNRAKIIDRNNNILAISVPAWTMYADPIEVLEPAKTAAFLHNLMPEKDLSFLIKNLNLKKRFVEIDRVTSPIKYQAIF
jgi:Cell division protein FtsI/penicillin-binding protein 2